MGITKKMVVEPTLSALAGNRRSPRLCQQRCGSIRPTQSEAQRSNSQCGDLASQGH